jgi:Phasin protein
MTNTAAEINAFLENSRKLAEPVARFQELAARTTERFARYGYEVAGDFLNLGIATLYTTSQSKDLPELLKKQSELANQYYEKQTQRSQDLLKIAGETQATVTQWIDQTSTEFTQRAAKTAKAA